MRGEVCLVWMSEDEAGQTCWNAELYGLTVAKNLKLHNAGTYQVWAAAGRVLSNVGTVEVR